MDTDDLSRETYKAIIMEAEKFNHDLTLRFGLLSYQCKDENEFIDKSIRLIEVFQNADSSYLFDAFFGEVPENYKLAKALDRIANNIVAVKRIPIEKRHFDF
jgi:hypothetical protein